MHLGVILPNFEEHASPAAVRMVAEAAEELGFDSVWATEHIIVGPEAVGRFGRLLEPFSVLSWIAGYTERVALGTSIVILPLHHPIRLAKEAATLQELSGGRFRLGIGMGWHEDEFRYMGVPFAGRGRRADEALRVMQALWAGEREFHGELWSFEDATFSPLPDPPPELWVGGGTDLAVRRTRDLDGVWHFSGGVEPEQVREVKDRYPDLRVIPRILADRLEEYLEAGCDGAVLSLGIEPGQIVAAMRELAPDVRPRRL